MAVNSQLALDLGDDYNDDETTATEVNTAIWYLMQQVGETTISAELSLPSVIEDGQIVDWTERILLAPIDRTIEPAVHEGPNDNGEGYTVDVAMC